MKEMLTFQSFDNREAAVSLSTTLNEHGIAVKVEENAALLDSNFIGQDFGNNILVKLWPQDFERAWQVLLDATEINMDETDRNYILFQMDDRELEAVIAAPEEWGVWNYKLATLILAERGTHISNEQTAALQETHINALAEPKKINGTWLAMGYGFSLILLISALLPAPFALATMFSFRAILALMGCILGVVLITSRKTLPDGRSIHSYDDHARKHGWGMLLFCLAAIALYIILLRLSMG